MLSADNNLSTICALQPATRVFEPSSLRALMKILSRDEVVLRRSGVEVMAGGVDGKPRPRGAGGGHS